MSVVAGYLAQRDLARREGRVERFFLNLVLMRVLYAHALVAAPQLALSWLAPAGRPLGDPRLGMTAICLSLSRILPDRYPVRDDVEGYVLSENSFGHLIDVGVIFPRLPQLFEWAAVDLESPVLQTLLDGEVPAYAWDTNDRDVWTPTPSALALLANCW